MIKETWFGHNYKVFNDKGFWLATFILRSDAEAFLRYDQARFKVPISIDWLKMWSKPFDSPELL